MTRTNSHSNQMSAADRLRELSRLQSEVGHSLYLRAKYASELLADLQWLDAKHKGDQVKAAEYLEAEYFRDLAGLVDSFGVIQLHNIYRWIPDEVKWQDASYNIRTLHNEYCNAHPVEKKDRASGARVSKAMLEEKEEEIRRLVRENAQLREQLEQAKQRISDLEKLVRALERDGVAVN